MAKTKTKNSPIFLMQYIDSDALNILGEKYQRELNLNRIAKIVSSFNEMVANEPKVSLRDGSYYVFDGQHTVAARILLNDGKDLPILCKVYQGLTEEEEAKLFAMQTGSATKPTPGEKMRAWLYAKDEDAHDFKKATESAGLFLELGDANCDFHLRCINTAHGLYRFLGEDMYKEALNIIVDAWEGSKESLKLEIIIAVSRFIHLYHDEYDRERLVWRLRSVDPVNIRNCIKTDLELVGVKKYINQIYKIYNGKGKQILEKKF